MSDEKHQDALKTIGEVADELGVATHVLRFWESKFTQIKPQKRRGRRYYGPEEVTIIKLIKELLYEQGYTVKGVQKFLRASKKGLSTGNVIEVISQNADTDSSDDFEDSSEDNDEEGSPVSSEQTEQLLQIYDDLCAARNKLRELV